MGKKKKKPHSEAAETDAVPAVRIDPVLHVPTRRACKRLNKGPTRFVNDLVREYLEANGYWPPPGAATPPPADTPHP